MRGFWLLLLFFLVCPDLSAFYNGRNNPDADFKSFDTRHFEVIYQTGLDSLARRAAWVAERALPSLLADLHVAETDLPKIRIVLTDLDDESNGFSSPLGQVIELFARPMNALTTDRISWIDRVTVHELAHQVTYAALRRSLGVYSTAYYLFFLPAWFVEGLAQFEAENWDRNRDFLLRSAYARGAFLDRAHMQGFIGSDDVGSRLVYEQGHAFYRFLASKYGKDIGGRLLERLRIFRPTLNAALKSLTRLDERTLMAYWKLELEKDYAPDGGGHVFNQGEAALPVMAGRFSRVYSILPAEGGVAFTATERAGDAEQNLYLYRRGRETRKVAGPEAGVLFSVSPDGQTLLFSQMIRSAEGTLRRGLFVSDLQGHVRSFNGLHGEDPCFLADGSVVFARCRMGRTRLFHCDNAGRGEEALLLPDSVDQALAPCAAGDRIFFSVIELSGERTIASALSDGSDYRIEAQKPGADLRTPAVSSKGVLAYMSNEDGAFNIEVRNPDGALRRITSDPYGAFLPRFNAAGDSVTVIALRDNGPNFDFAPFAVPLDADRSPSSWDMEQPWKTGTGFDRSLLSDSSDDDAESELELTDRPSGYIGLFHLRPVLLFPVMSGFGLPDQIRALFEDPVGRHALSLGLLLNRDHGLGYEAQYVNRSFWPDLSFRAATWNDADSADLGSGQLIEEQRTVVEGALQVRWPFTAPRSVRFSHGLLLGAGVREERLTYRGFLFWPDNPRSVFTEQDTLSDIPLSGGYYLDYTPKALRSGSAVYPLNALYFSGNYTVSDAQWGGDYRYRHLDLSASASLETGADFHTLYARAGLFNLFPGGNTRFGFPFSRSPRGLLLDTLSLNRYLSGTLEYRFMVTRDLDLSLSALHMEMLTVAPFVDAVLGNPEGTVFRDFIRERATFWTAGVQIRQRLYLFGKAAGEAGFYIYYDQTAQGRPYDYRFNLSGATLF